ncbi:MAG TPA: DUF3027 domain-containing protein [Marmoricola sp.]
MNDLATRPDTVEFARAVLHEQVGTAAVGDHLEVESSDAGVETHYFAAAQRGYPGWRWSVTVVSITVDEAAPTVDEIVLLPGADAIVAPAWVPWRERIRPGDLSPGDLLPVEEDDERLAPGYFTADEEFPLDKQVARAVAQEVGLGRSRVLSAEGRNLAAQRWYDGEHGPSVPLAQSAPGRCEGCGFMLRLAGPMSELFGVCANAFANDDGRVVSLDHGCGAHSEAQLRKKQLPQPLPDPVFDSMTRDDLESF